MDQSPPAPIAYRAFQIGADDHVKAAYPIDASTDDEAMASAAQLVDGYAIELWAGGRKIARFEPRLE